MYYFHFLPSHTMLPATLAKQKQGNIIFGQQWNKPQNLYGLVFLNTHFILMKDHQRFKGGIERSFSTPV